MLPTSPSQRAQAFCLSFGVSESPVSCAKKNEGSGVEREAIFFLFLPGALGCYREGGRVSVK